MLPFLASAQNSITGQVTDNYQNALPGATIKVKNHKTAVLSDASGNFTLGNLSNGNYTLVVSYVGYKTQEKAFSLSGNAVLNFSLVQQNFLADEVIVRATRANEKSATTYKNVSKAEIEENNFGQDLPFILQNTPGVVVNSDAGAGVGYTGIRIRGSDNSRINVTVNGIPINDSESQGTFYVNMPDFASSVDNIQIQRGVGTSTNGAGAFGASLNIQTTASELEPYAEINNTYGSFNTWKNTVKVGTGLINNRFSFDGRLSRISSDGYVDRGASLLKSYFMSGAYHGNKDLLRINVFAGTEKTYQSWNGIPESRLNNDVAGMQAYIERNGLNAEDAANLLNAGRTYNSFLYNNQTDNYKQNHYQLLYARQLSDQFSFNGALHYTQGEGYYEEFRADDKLSDYGLNPVIAGATTITNTDLIRRRWLDNDFYGVTYAFNYVPQKNLNFTLGGAYNEYKGAHFGQVIWAQYASNGNIDRHYYDNEGFKTDFNLYGKVNYSPVEQLSLFADLQYRRVYYDISGTENKLNTLAINDQLNFFNPKFGATYFINPKSNVYASFSVANKEPNRDDYVDAAVGVFPKSERLNDVELGYRFKNSRFNLGANAYGMFYKNQLVVTGKINDVGGNFRQNVDNSYRLGIELDGSYTINKFFALNANAALSRNKIKNFTEYYDDYDNGGQVVNQYALTDISFSPAAVLFGEFVYKPLKGLAIALQSKYVSKQYLDNTQNNDRTINGYWVSNARLGYNFKFASVKNINLGLLVNNLLDKKYESNGYTYGYLSGGNRITENFYYPQAGTNFLLNLNVKF
ncbi:iron complex outermembrane receptor protein [Pedobacter psychrotolerans]|uniref:Iron complex outermembrane receptor protein n=2 Tax=Pedobacter psychrotolerans TaxID=1843235 RepID=A0A4R2HGG6_9SPHI|nr:iron complex outermembrane receptor protein [Pedobacter psychrotolerans]GGE59333.1 TonB-dependent receptor [Pedobacter psychrotolerans]